VALLDKFTGVIELNIEVVFFGLGSESDLLEGCSMVLVFFMGLANPAFLLILPLSIIHYPTNRGVAGGRYFDKV
jgi:hypothetical protein